jgi:microsomal dipeptidase-like Zn-dependent dipeptidase
MVNDRWPTTNNRQPENCSANLTTHSPRGKEYRRSVEIAFLQIEFVFRRKRGYFVAEVKSLGRGESKGERFMQKVTIKRLVLGALGVLMLAIVLVFMLVPQRVDRSFNQLSAAVAVAVSTETAQLHQSLFVADLHADALLWKRDLLERHDYGLVDLPRLQAGNMALQVFSVVTKVPRTLNYDRNEGDSDFVTALALVQLWPVPTWISLKARALYQAEKLHAFSRRSKGRLVLIKTQKELAAFVEQRKQEPQLVAGVLAMEGMHALEGKLENVEEFFAAGYRMLAPTHFFDNELGGSAHGVSKAGLTEFGASVIKRMEALGLIVDVAHASPKMIDDILRLATRPIVSSHTGVKGTCEGPRNLSDEHLRGIAATGGVVGIGLWEGAVCAENVQATVAAMRYTANLIGVDHVGLGSDFDGAIRAPIEASGMAQITQALLAAGFTPEEIYKIMGGNVLRVLSRALPQE